MHATRDHLCRRGLAQAGFTLAEVAFGMLVFIIAAVVMLNHLTLNYSNTRSQRDTVFAYGKAQAMLAEIQAFVDRGAAQAAVDLDSLDDGITNKATLSITRDPVTGVLVPADHPISGNFQRESNWVWSRRITVRPFSGLDNRNVRYVTVQIFKRDEAGNDHSLATISSVVNSVGSSFPTSQVYDLYLLAIENIPGWWVFMESIVPFVESAITDLESRNPGLNIRTHWITKASYGRDQLYRPYINVAADSRQDVRWSYFYPGRMPAGSASQYYYVPDLIKARMLVDGVPTREYDIDTNPMPYSVADWFNHAMRLPQERTFHDQRVAMIRARRIAIETAIRNSNPPPPAYVDMSEEPTLRLLLEDMATDSDRYRNAWLINLHGELLPVPALRNYSDAARLPTRIPNLRVVTHAEELRTQRPVGFTPGAPVRLRVHAYTTNPTWVTNRAAYLALPEATAPKLMPANMPIAIEIPDLDLTDGVNGSTNGTNGLFAGVRIEGIAGGTDRNGTPVEYTSLGALPSRNTVFGPDLATVMHWEIEFDPARRATVIKLYNTPLVAPYVQNSVSGVWQGVADSTRAKLYGFDYVPSCTEAGADFSRNLASGGNAPKNTARWVITVPPQVFASARFVDGGNNYIDPASDVRVDVRTRIWDAAVGFDAGTVLPAPIQPQNLSETYSWWGETREAVPFTERSQFLGDPRHCPYRDVTRNDPDFPNGYNWFHDALTNNSENAAVDFPALDGARLRNRWLGRLRSDVPRFYELLRTALVRCGAVYTTLTGFSYYYMGMGGEIGYDSANGYPSSIPVSMQPWGWGPGTSDYVNSITWTRHFVRQGWGVGAYWWSIPWLGELYPDNRAAGWEVSGNLPASNGVVDFVQQMDQVVYQNSINRAYGTAVAYDRHITSSEGCTSFCNIGTSASTFHHQFATGNSTLVAAGLDLQNRYNFPMPLTAPSNRPFRIDTNFSGGVGDEWNYAPYSSSRFLATLPKQYYDHPSGGNGSGLVELRSPAGTESAYVVFNGISNAVASGSAFIAKYSVLTMVQSFLEGATPQMTNGITQLPRVEIETPTEITEIVRPTAIDVRWDVEWRRWDGQTYTTATPVTFTQPESNLDYVVMYSVDNGDTWLVCNRDLPVTPGERPTDPTLIRADTGVGAETLSWAVPAAQFPQGTYLVRVDCFRRGLTLHYSQHQTRLFINR